MSCSSPTAQPAARLLRALLTPATGFDFPEVGGGGTIRLEINARDLTAPEGYRLRVGEEHVSIVASTPEGLVNGVQTLRQLLSPAACSPGELRRTWLLPAVEIEDAPRFSWRGAMLDVSRHFVPLAFLFRFVDLLGLHKLNMLHLHLTDDQGWRFASAAYPRLVEVGAWRSASRAGHPGDHSRRGEATDGTPHGGFYSWDQLRTLVSYSAERNITVVPEIDLPGHVQAVIAAYPELGNVGPLEVRTSWGVSKHVLSLSNEAMAFSRRIWDEALEIFPSTFVHIGGDECPTVEWRSSPVAKDRLAMLGSSNMRRLQSWFTGQLCEHLLAAGRRPIGWDEILGGGALAEGVAVMAWRGEQHGIARANAGGDVVMCPEKPCYFDHYQSDDREEPIAIGGLNTLADVYGWDPVPGGLSPEQVPHILGTQFNLWSEYLVDPTDFEYMAFPRAAALAEIAWSQGPRDPAGFERRLRVHLERLDALGVNYRPLAGPRPWQRGGVGSRRRCKL